MKILDIYILKKYIGTFIYLVLGLCLIICVIDLSEKNDDFMDAGLSYGEVITGYYAYLVPYLANFLAPLMVFISTILVTAQLASHTEIIAMLAGGISLKRIIWIYMMGAIALGSFTFYSIGWLIPESNAKRIDFEFTYLGEELEYDARDVHLRANDSTYIYLQHFNNAIETGYQFSYEVMDGKDCVYRLKSSRVVWDTAFNMWSMNNYSERTYRDGKETYGFYKKKKMTDAAGITPEDFGSGHMLHQMLTIPELDKYIQKETIKGTGGMDVFITEYYERFAYPFAVIILTFMGVVVSARKSRDGIAKQLVIGFVLCFVYYAFLQLGRNFTSSEDFHPAVSAWIPNIVFFIAGIVLYRAIPK